MSHYDITATSERPCACGCGEMVRVRTNRGHLVLRRPGHHRVVAGLVKQRDTSIPCQRCGKLYLSRNPLAKYCSRQCYWGKPASYEIKGKISGTKPLDRSVFAVSRSQRIQREYLLAQRQNCDKCGWGKYLAVLELHHRNEDPSDGRLENLELLCPTCHDSHHFEMQTGRFDNTRYTKAKELREKLGLPSLPARSTRNVIQRLINDGTITFNSPAETGIQ